MSSFRVTPYRKVGYAPSLAGTWVFFAIFILLTVTFFFQSYQYPTWRYYALTIAFGCLLEAIGYIARLLLHYNPFSQPGFNMSLALLTIAPALFAASVYSLLTEMMKTFSPSLALDHPNMYAQVFIACDAVAIIFQTAGGAAAATATTEQKAGPGHGVMLVGLVFQLVTMLAFGATAVVYFARVWRNRLGHDRNTIRYVPEASMGLWSQARFKRFLSASAGAYSLLLVRCCYRVHAYGGGWGNAVLRDEGLFIALDSSAISAAVLLLACYHPARCTQLEGDNISLLKKPVGPGPTGPFPTSSPAPSIASGSLGTASPAQHLEQPVSMANKEFGLGGRPRIPSYIAPRTSQPLPQTNPPLPTTPYLRPTSTATTGSRLKAWFSPWSTPGVTPHPKGPGVTPLQRVSSNASARSGGSLSIKSSGTWTGEDNKVSPLDDDEGHDNDGSDGNQVPSPSYPFPRVSVRVPDRARTARGGARSRDRPREPERAVRVTGSLSPDHYGAGGGGGGVSGIVRVQHSLPKAEGYHVLTTQSRGKDRVGDGDGNDNDRDVVAGVRATIEQMAGAGSHSHTHAPSGRFAPPVAPRPPNPAPAPAPAPSNFSRPNVRASWV